MNEVQAAFTFAVVCEAEADQETATELAERVLLEDVDWLEPEALPGLRSWCGLEPKTGHLTWRAIGNEAKRRRLKVHGRFRDMPGKFDERRAKLALLLFTSLDHQPDAVVMIRDTDGREKEVRGGIERARTERAWNFPVVLGTPHPNRECWVLTGFEPQNSAEEQALAEERSSLGFDPRMHAERLTAKGKRGKLNAKKVLGRLAPANGREKACWRETDLQILRDRGQSTGLAAFFDEVQTALVPLVAGS